MWSQMGARVGSEALATCRAAVALAVAGVTADLTYSPLRGYWAPDESRIGVALLALIAGSVIYQLLGWITEPVGKRLTEIGHGWPPHTLSTEASWVPATTLEDSIAQVAAAAADDAAARAAHGAQLKLDSSGASLLTDADCWRGYENGEAHLFLAPGVSLYFREVGAGYGRESKQFTLLTSEGEGSSTDIRTLAQLHQHLRARAAGLPVAPPAVDSANDVRSLSPAV
ncbi:hypothetical protein GCM10010321_89150 [Streptomyces chartreusis]|nr:hypothetical protein GCM10010321_89150 [Streptomyces chartreusis]